MNKLTAFVIVLVLALTGCTSSDTSQYSCTSVDGTSYFRCSTTLTEIGASMNGSEIAVNFTGYVKKKSAYDPLVDLVKSEFLRLNHIFDKYNDVAGVNNVKAINDNAGIAPVVVDQALIDLLLIAKEWTTKSEGTFDITLGSVLKIWHNYREEGQNLNSNGQLGPIPTLPELQNAAKYVGWNFVQIDDTANTVYLTDTHASLDLGGISKGYATDLVAAKLKEAGLESGLLSFGGSSSVIIGSKPNGLNWNVAVRAPIRGNPYVELDNVYFPASFALSSSGDDQNYYQGSDNNYYHHIIDPVTLYPVNHGVHSVTVFTTETATIAEALSKTLFILPIEQAYAYLDQYNLDHPDQTLYAIWIFDYQQSPAGYDTVDFLLGDSGSAQVDAPYTLLYSSNLKGMTLSFK
jgi:thiamine biosynthesis lipoprotein